MIVKERPPNERSKSRGNAGAGHRKLIKKHMPSLMNTNNDDN